MTPPQEASAAQVSDAGSAEREDLILPPAEIFDRAAIRNALDAAAASTDDTRAFRNGAVKTLKDAIASGRAALERAFGDRPLDSRPLVRSYCYLTDCVVETVFDLATRHLSPGSDPNAVAVLAVGGYGRGEMAPFSDVDLLFLSEQKISGPTEAVIEAMLYVFWDLHLKVGHASRTARECLKLGREDYTIRTSLLENRMICGNGGLSKALNKRLWAELFRGTASDYVEAKLDERTQRHKKQGGQRYMVEPNVKEGKGGLRDLQTLYWIAKYVNGVDTVEALVKDRVFTEAEYRAFDAAETFLLTVRCHLHLLSGRAVEQLTFDMQVEVADRMGYSDRGGRRAVEYFMQDYFRHATKVGEVTRILLTDLEARHVKAVPSLHRLLSRKKKVRDGFRILQNRLTYENEKQFLSEKLNILAIFEEALRTGYLLHPDAMRLIAANLQMIDAEMRESPEARRIFFDTLLKHGNPERALRRMNELGVLAAFIPEFAPVVAMMQFNMYHHFTVDEHTIQCIATLAKIERGELVEELPIASRILKEGVNRKVLFLALFLHDIGKGRDEDHAVLGAMIARKVAPRLGLKREECETVEWLVRYHLLMSDMAQKRDISDPRTIRDFAKAVKTRKRMDLLTVLTVCDIRGVGPGVWNNWKAVLIRNLYRATASALEHGLEEVNRETLEAEAKRALRDALSDRPQKEVRAEIARHYGPYWQGLPLSVHLVFAQMLRSVADGDVCIDLLLDADRDATRACFVLQDHPGIFSRLAGALALSGANVVDARSYTTKDGFATAVFWVQDQNGHPFEESRLPRLSTMIRKTLKGEVVVRDAVRDKDRLKKREKAFRVPTSITFDNEGSEIYTIIEVDTRDRPGLLYDLARCLAAHHINVASAVIATYGEQAVDSFYVKDLFGLKMHSEAKQKTLERHLRDAIERGAARALD